MSDELKLPRISLPSINFSLPEREIDLTKEVKKLAQMTKRVGMGSDVFKTNFLRIFRALEKGEFSPFMLQTPNQVRAYLAIATSNEVKDEVKKQVHLSPELIDQFAAVRSPMSRLSLMMLIQLYFDRFDTLESGENFENLCKFLKNQVNKLDKIRQRKEAGDLVKSDLARYAEFASQLFSPTAPHKIVKMARQNQQDFTHTLQDMGIAAFKNGRLLQISQSIYYIETLKTIPLGEYHQIFEEVTKADIIQVQYDKHYWIGHKVVEILIDRTVKEGGELSEVWQNVILDIADDPRIASEINLNQWWLPLGEKRVEQMRSWLSRHDLKLFLKLLEQSAVDLGKTDMERMFAGRKQFLEALFDHDCIRHSRLFFTREAANYLRYHYAEPHRLDAYARVSGEASVIYLQLKNGWHLVEGTHSFRVRYFHQIPKYSRIADYQHRFYERDELSGGLEGWYRLNFGKQMYSTAHDVHSSWKFKLLDWFKKTGINLPADEVLDSWEYYRYREQNRG